MTAIDMAHWIVVLLGLPVIVLISIGTSRALSHRLDTMSRRLDAQSGRVDVAASRLDRLEERANIQSDLLKAHAAAYQRHCESREHGGSGG